MPIIPIVPVIVIVAVDPSDRLIIESEPVSTIVVISVVIGACNGDNNRHRGRVRADCGDLQVVGALNQTTTGGN